MRDCIAKTIPLTQGQVVLVDAEDFNYLNQWKWYAFYNYKVSLPT
jgi:hypothetical protein